MCFPAHALFRCVFAACYFMPLILVARLRLRMMDLADPLFFCPSGRDQRGPSGRALSGLSRPQRRGRSASPSFGNHLYPLGDNLLSDSEALFNFGKTLSFQDYKGRSKSVKLYVLKYAQRRGCSYSVLDLYSMKVHSENVWPSPDTSPPHLHLGEAEKSNTCKLRNPARASYER